MKAKVYRVVTGACSYGTCYIVEAQTWRGWKSTHRSFVLQIDAEKYIDALNHAGIIVAVKAITEYKR